MFELWDDEEPMRSCGHCMHGAHDLCEDIIITLPYGPHACGCENKYHDWQYML